MMLNADVGLIKNIDADGKRPAVMLQLFFERIPEELFLFTDLDFPRNDLNNPTTVLYSFPIKICQ